MEASFVEFAVREFGVRVVIIPELRVLNNYDPDPEF
jgi:hypothetical protein